MNLLRLKKAAVVLAAACVAAFPVCAEDTAKTDINESLEMTVTAEQGTQENPYVITDAEGLKLLATLTESGETQNVYFKLESDIVLNSHDMFTYTDGYVTSAKEGAVKWAPVGTEAKPFCGVLDGNGHYITGLYCDNTNELGGLFGVCDGAVVTDLNIEFSLVEAKSYAGLVAGKIKNGTEIYNCVVSGSVIGKQQELSSVVGGIAGTVDESSKIVSSAVYAAVSGSNAFSTNVGGIAGLNNGTIKKCAFGGKAYGVSMYFGANAGGIAGANHGEIAGCLSQGTVGAETSVEVNESNAGGIAGYSDGFVQQSKNESYVTSHCASYSDSISTAGGIVGYVKNSDVYGCENKGKVEGTLGVFAGGIAGLSVVDSGEHKIYDCLNKGDVVSDYGMAGGLVARMSASGYVTSKNELLTSVSTASVNGTSFAGAVAKVYKDGSEVNAESTYHAAGYSDGFTEGTAGVSTAGFTSGTALEGITNTDVWVFESGSLPYLVFADGIAKNTSKLTAESTQVVTGGKDVAVTGGAGTITYSRPLTTGAYDVTVRFTGDENTFAPSPVVVNVTVVKDINALEIASVDTSAVTFENGTVSGKLKITFYAPGADLAYTVINSILVDGKYETLYLDSLTTQAGFFEVEFTIPATAVTGTGVELNTMVVADTESLSPVCENVKSEL